VTNPKTQAEAEAKFKRKQGRATEASQAMSDYHAAAHATREKTTRLRKLREAKEVAETKAQKRTMKSAGASERDQRLPQRLTASESRVAGHPRKRPDKPAPRTCPAAALIEECRTRTHLHINLPIRLLNKWHICPAFPSIPSDQVRATQMIPIPCELRTNMDRVRVSNERRINPGRRLGGWEGFISVYSLGRLRS
jgi:hypothetical protein